MPRKAHDELPWFQRVAAKMVREDKSFRQACAEEGVNLRSDEAETYRQRTAFQRVLRQARHNYHFEIGADPNRTKTATLGQLQLAANKLMEGGEFQKAAEVLFKIAKIEGWVGVDSTENPFAALSAKALAELRDQLKAKDGSEPPTASRTDQSLLN